MSAHAIPDSRTAVDPYRLRVGPTEVELRFRCGAPPLETALMRLCRRHSC